MELKPGLSALVTGGASGIGKKSSVPRRFRPRARRADSGAIALLV
jgi:hypothetical protein